MQGAAILAPEGRGDQADVAALYKHLRFAGVTIVTIAAGEISELHVGLKRTADHRDRHILVGSDGIGGCGGRI